MENTAKPKNFLDFGHTRILKRDDGIVEVICGEDVRYEVEDLFEMHAASSRLVSKQRMPTLFMVGKNTSISQDAMKYGATEEATALSAAEAYVIQSIPQKILANFYLRIHKPPVPTRFFDDRKEAEAWLRTFIVSSN
jgi:hypothetical protein